MAGSARTASGRFSRSRASSIAATTTDRARIDGADAWTRRTQESWNLCPLRVALSRPHPVRPPTPHPRRLSRRSDHRQAQLRSGLRRVGRSSSTTATARCCSPAGCSRSKAFAHSSTAWSKRSADMKLVIVGDGPLRAMVEAAASTDRSIDYRGLVSQASVVQMMATADLVVVPSEWYEGFPLVIPQSLSVGTPVLVSDIENIGQPVMSDRRGWTFKTGDAFDLAQQLGHLERPRDQLREARQRARRSYETNYSPSVNLKRLEALYGEVVSEMAVRSKGCS